MCPLVLVASSSLRKKSRIFSYRNLRALPQFTMGGSVVPHCTQYQYLGSPVRITPAIPARQRVHPFVQDVLGRLQQRFAPVKWLANHASGISIPVAKTIYILFLRSVIDYLSPALCQLPKTSLEPLDKFQNRVMRFILGCPLSTRVVNMQAELDLPPLVERIYANVTYFSIKCLHFPQLAPHYSSIIRTSLLPDTPRLVLRPGGLNLVRKVCDNIRTLAIDVPPAEIDPGLPPWQIPHPPVFFTPTSKEDLPLLQKQAALEAIARVSSTVPAAHHLYVDGSLQADGSSAARSVWQNFPVITFRISLLPFKAPCLLS